MVHELIAITASASATADLGFPCGDHSGSRPAKRCCIVRRLQRTRMRKSGLRRRACRIYFDRILDFRTQNETTGGRYSGFLKSPRPKDVAVNGFVPSERRRRTVSRFRSITVMSAPRSARRRCTILPTGP